MYIIARKGWFESPVQSTVTIDEGFHQLRKLAKSEPGFTFFLANRSGLSGAYAVRAFAREGRACWARKCKCDGLHDCVACKGVGYIEDYNA